MKAGLLIILILNSSILLGQSKWEMVGEYSHSIFMYSYTLTLKDSENYEIIESSDLGSERTIGTWTIRGQAIRLTPKKKIHTDVHKMETERILDNPREEAVVIETKNLLRLLDRDFKLERAK
jgi:hypothetical protein